VPAASSDRTLEKVARLRQLKRGSNGVGDKLVVPEAVQWVPQTLVLRVKLGLEEKGLKDIREVRT
jgi:hypothetical protein